MKIYIKIYKILKDIFLFFKEFVYKGKSDVSFEDYI